MKSNQEKETIWEGNKEHAQKVAEHYNEAEGRYELAHGETGLPIYKAVRCKEGWRVKKTRNFYYGTFYNGLCLADGKLERYLTPAECETYMNPATGSIDTYDGWWYAETDADGNYTGKEVNAVDLDEVVPVEWNFGCWVRLD